MPDITIYMTEDDEERFIRFVFEKHAWLIPDMNYAEPRAVKIESIKSYKESRNKLIRKFYIQRQDFTTSPLNFRSITKDGVLFHYISQRQGGPNIDFSGGGIFEEAGLRYIRPGECGYYPTYRDTIFDKNRTASPALRIFYAQLKNFLLAGSKRLLNTKSRPWVLPSAILNMQKGAKLVGFENHTIADLQTEKNGHNSQRKKILKKL
jgi:hypothetical protein